MHSIGYFKSLTYPVENTLNGEIQADENQAEEGVDTGGDLTQVNKSNREVWINLGKGDE